MNIEKLIQAVGYILSKYNSVLNYTKLIKLLYLSDRKSLSETGYTITGDTYVSMKNGPVLSTLYDLIKNKKQDTNIQFYWNSKFTTDGYNLHQVCSFIPKGELSDSDLQIMDEVDKDFHDKSYSQMIEFVHNTANCPEWKDTLSSIPLKKSDIMKAIGFTDEEINAIEDEEKSYKAEDELLERLNAPICEVQ